MNESPALQKSSVKAQGYTSKLILAYVLQGSPFGPCLFIFALLLHSTSTVAGQAVPCYVGFGMLIYTSCTGAEVTGIGSLGKPVVELRIVTWDRFVPFFQSFYTEKCLTAVRGNLLLYCS